MRRPRLTAAMLASASLVVALPGAEASAATVCNEAENSHQGGYVVTGGPVDPLPPAFLRGSQMKIGGGAGVENAAFRAPALRLCGPEGEDPTDPTDPIGIS